MSKHPELKEEVETTLIFIAEMDIDLHGHISQSTLECFEIQKVELPEEYKKYVKV